MGIIPTREQAYALLTEYNDSESLIKHALAVEGAMRRFASLLGEDADYWGAVGLLHDLDYQRYPDEHCAKSAELLGARGIDGGFVHAVVSHGYGVCSEVEPIHIMEKVLYTIDELTGLIVASALMRPDKSVKTLEFKSLNKKYKSPAFAAGVDRGLIERGVAMLSAVREELTFEYVCVETINGMRDVAEVIGLAGTVDE